jgi:hypothetical protein
MLFRPTKQSSVIVVSVSQGQLFDKSIQSIPRISINPVRPSGSLVFQVVEEGRVDSFRAMLADGQASVRDRDEDGKSLLHVSRRPPK